MQKVIPDKFFFKIGEVSELTDVEPYVLRYWETEFKFRLTKTKNNQRLYQKKDIEKIQDIKKLLYEDRYTIAGARKKLKAVIKERKIEQKKPKDQLELIQGGVHSAGSREMVKKVRQHIASIDALLDQDELSFLEALS